MYRVNDVVVNGQRIPNIFNTQDEAFHSKYAKPIGGFWTLTKVLELEPLMDETIQKFVNKLGSRFADASGSDKVCMMDDWLTYCKALNSQCDGGNCADLYLVAWDFAANVTFGKHYGFIDEGKDIQGMIKESADGLYYFAPVSATVTGFRSAAI